MMSSQSPCRSKCYQALASSTLVVNMMTSSLTRERGGALCRVPDMVSGAKLMLFENNPQELYNKRVFRTE